MPLSQSLEALAGAAARAWIRDLAWADLDEEAVEDLGDGEAIAGVARHYEGGWSAFARDAGLAARCTAAASTRPAGETGAWA
jgi:hypothetical protein